MSPHLTRLKDLVIDLVEQLNASNAVLDQRHFRMLLHLTSSEKVRLSIQCGTYGCFSNDDSCFGLTFCLLFDIFNLVSRS